MRTSKEGLRLITQREGKILHVYRDSKGLPTAGVGHLLLPDEKKAMPVGTKITQQQCDEWLAADLKECEDAVNGLGVKLTQNEFDALVSLTLNIGVGGFNRSTVARRLKAGDHKAAAEAILLWDKPKEIQGRRRGEYHQFKTPYSAAVSNAGGGSTVNKNHVENPSDPPNDPAGPPPTPPAQPEEPVLVQTVGAEKSEDKTPEQPDFLDRINTRIVSLTGGVGTLLTGVATWLASNSVEMVKWFMLSAGAVAIVAVIATVFRNERKDARAQDLAAEKLKIDAAERERRETQAHEVQLALIAAAASKETNTVVLQKAPPPATEMPNSDPESA